MLFGASLHTERYFRTRIIKADGVELCGLLLHFDDKRITTWTLTRKQNRSYGLIENLPVTNAQIQFGELVFLDDELKALTGRKNADLCEHAYP
jgi:hypothetical protein